MGFLFIAFSFSFLISCSNEDAASKTDLAKVFADSSKYTTAQWLDSVQDFGTVMMGEKVKITFRCKNTGKKLLYLSDVRPGCGCTVADYTKEPISPGKQGNVVAEFDSKKSHPGKVRKTIFVHTNTKNITPRYLIFSGEIQAVDSTHTASKKY